MKPFRQKTLLQACPMPVPIKTLANSVGHQKESTVAGLYDLGETIGKGHYAIVKLAHHVFTGEKVAVKVINKSKLDEASKAHLFQEVRCMKLVQHENVVKLYQVIDTQTKLYLILEFADGGDMYDYIMKHDKGLSEDLAKHYFLQIVNAIDFCHKLHVVHRDLKPENVVFFKSQNVVKLTDFGFSNRFVPGNKLETSCGSLAYSAPEILLGDSYDAPAVDIWSLGVILYMLVCGEAPFHEANDSETLTMIMDCKYTIPSYLSESCKELIGKMLVREPNDRAKLSDILSHPWLTDGKTSQTRTSELPLVCQEVLSIEDHNCIVEKMIAGNFATLQEISDSLREKAYDHITATYYLLAERLLKKRRVSLSEGIIPINPEVKTVLSPLALSPRTSSSSCDIPKNMTGDLERSRTPFECLVSPPSSHISPANSSCFLNPISLEDDDDTCTVSVKRDFQSQQSFRSRNTPSPSHSPSLVSFPIGLGPALAGRPLFTVQSSPQLLNEICEEEESDIEDNSRETSLMTLNLTSQKANGSRNKNLESMRRKKMSARNRGASNISSSEDVSESEEQSGTRRGMTRCRLQRCGRNDMMRRDSSEHSSDTDGQSGFLGRGRVLNDLHHNHHSYQSQKKQNNDSQCNNFSSSDNKRYARDVLTDNSDNISEIDDSREDLEHEPQIHLLKAALKKLSASIGEQEKQAFSVGMVRKDLNLGDDENRNKLSSVMEENLNQSTSSLSSSSLSISSDVRYHVRRTTSLGNISNIQWNSLKFLDLQSPKLTEKCVLERMMMMVWDETECYAEGQNHFRPLNPRNSYIYRSVDTSLQDETNYNGPLIKNWSSVDRPPLNISLLA